MAQKRNFQKEQEQIVSGFDPNKPKPSLLLHACCGPCSSAVMELLSRHFSITIYYYNPNIHPQEEYFRRLNELKKFVGQFPPAVETNICIVEEAYNPQEYFDATRTKEEPQLQTEPEKGERCRRCYEFRMKKAWDYALKNRFDFFTTTLSISPHKDSQKINEIGESLIPVNNLKYLPADFKKNNGYLRSLQLSREYGLYRQDYCGCIYSMTH